MRKNFSPWLYQLNKDRKIKKLNEDLETGVAIIGAGIAGISTAFFILKNTDKKVVMLEKYKLAHGATGHNGGHLLAVFERDFASMAEEFGLPLALEGLQAIESTWLLLDEMYTDAGLDIPLSRFVGHAGLTSLDQVVKGLHGSKLLSEAGHSEEPMLVADSAPFLNQIPVEYKNLFKVVPHEEILSRLETTRQEFIALTSHQAGCMNSALFCEEILVYLLERYPERFAIYEETPVGKIVLHEGNVLLDAVENTLTAERVVLCTNGFENLLIVNKTGLDINARYHHNLEGVVGFMSGYLESMNKPPAANAFFEDGISGFGDPYFYLTRRPYEYEAGLKHNLISIGGPEIRIGEASPYSYEDGYPDEKAEEIDKFVKQTYDLEQNKKIEYIFTWHGLMGYTKNGIRMIGPEPQNPVLLYNLGCNGIGLLPSIYGGKKVARHISGEDVDKSIFDVPTRQPN